MIYRVWGLDGLDLGSTSGVLCLLVSSLLTAVWTHLWGIHYF